jgi:hypothetical protein
MSPAAEIQFSRNAAASFSTRKQKIAHFLQNHLLEVNVLGVQRLEKCLDCADNDLYMPNILL